MRSLRLLLLAPLAGACAFAGGPSPALALGDGEMLHYRIGWVLLPGAGELEVNALSAFDPTGAPLLRIISTVSSRGLARIILPFDWREESLFDATNGRLIWYGESTRARDRHKAHTVTFDYSKGIADYAESTGARDKETIPLPRDSLPSEIVTCLLSARTWNLKPGGIHEAMVLFNDQLFDLTVHAIDYERIYTPLGVFRTLMLEPRMEKTPPKGMFAHGSTVGVWISQDARSLPVRLRVGFPPFGSGTATLVEYRPPVK